jgi:hypothetical protein
MGELHRAVARGPRIRSSKGYGPVTAIDTHELAWAAGLFDGEGCVRFRRGARGRGLTCSVGQKDREVLDRFHRAVGVGSIYHERRSDGIYVWQVGARDHVHRVMWLLWPWLSSLKRQQFEQTCNRYAASTVGGEFHNEVQGVQG